ncbi:uncharacterized protein LOC125017696 isoform X2 [Mugil cephalus]|uniref:uncharacterized protein LOC125017696 isoform X2 n=1 Tax=Mugil cephalus TaxID=48193 RepID=UPI001FB5AC94|nr:uncharacterized protein LOC125017696 isoform X2 [Mugil cephalus]
MEQTFPVSAGGHISSGQSTQQLNQQNVPSELVAAANTLKKYYDQRHTDPNIQSFFEDLFARALGLNADTASSSRSQKKFSRGVKVHTVTTGETFGADQVLLRRVNCEELLLERTDRQRCDVIILFCPIISRVGSDVDAAMSGMSVSAGGKPVILVLMHHTRKVNYSTPEKNWSETFENVVLDVDVLYHETVRGLLECPKNQETVNQIQRQLLKYSGTVYRSEKSSIQSTKSSSCCIT